VANSSGGYIPKGDNKARWESSAAEFSEEGSKLTILGKPVMESWEDPFMKKLASIAASNGGRVLEVGFGLGISASYVQSFPIEEHVLIEANGEVFKRLEQFGSDAKKKATPLFGLWEDVLPSIPDSSFDGILYDTYPLSEQDLHVHQFRFIKEAHRILKDGGVLTYCNLTSWGNLKNQYPDDLELFAETQSPHLKECGFQDCHAEVFEIDPPAECQYYRYPTVIAPTIRK
jgi:guanidinoacetate N-methyltransferase